LIQNYIKEECSGEKCDEWSKRCDEPIRKRTYRRKQYLNKQTLHDIIEAKNTITKKYYKTIKFA